MFRSTSEYLKKAKLVPFALTLLLSTNAFAGISDKGGGRTTEIKAKLIEKNRPALIEQLKHVFSNEPATLMSLRSYVANFLNNRAVYVKNSTTRKILKDVSARGASDLILSKVKFVHSAQCIDKNGESSSAVAPVSNAPPANPEICVNLDKIVSDEGPDIKDSTLIALTVHEVVHFYGYDDLSHELATDIAEFVAGAYSNEEHTLVKMPEIEINKVKPEPTSSTSCAIPVENGLSSSPCNPIEFVNSTGEKDIYTKKEFSFAARHIDLQPVMLTNGNYSRRVLRIVSKIDVPYSTGQLLGALRLEIAKVVRVENPSSDNAIGTIFVEVYPDRQNLDLFGHSWENKINGEVYDQSKRVKFYELKTQFEKSTGIVALSELRENTAYKIELKIIGNDTSKNVVSTPQYLIYFNVQDGVIPPIDYNLVTAPLVTEKLKELNPFAARAFNEEAYRAHLNKSLINYRRVCQSEGPCDGGLAQRTDKPLLTAAKGYVNAFGVTEKEIAALSDNYDWGVASTHYWQITREWNAAVGSGNDISLAKKRQLLEAIDTMLKQRPLRVNAGAEGDNWANGLIREKRLLELNLKSANQ